MSGQVLRTLQAARVEGRATGVELEGVRTVPGWAVRVVAGLLALLVPLAAGFATIRGPVAVVGDVLAVLLAGLVVGRPRTGWCAWLVLLAGLRVLFGEGVGAGGLALLLVAVHLAVIAWLLAARVEVNTRVELAVPLEMVRRAVPAQLAAQAVGLVVWLAGPAGTLPGAEAWRVLALVAAVSLVLLAVPARRRR